MHTASTHPQIIQGGMGVAVSGWRLARAVAKCGQLGVVSGTGIETLFVRRLQDGDPGGHVRRAMEHFPLRRTVDTALRRFFVPGGKAPDEPYRLVPLPRQVVSAVRHELTMLASFVEVWLAREGHDGAVGINLLTKILIPTLPTLYGAMLAGVSCVLMGAGIPREIPGALDLLADHEPASLRLEVEGGADVPVTFDPRAYWDDGAAPTLTRPQFLPIVSSNSLAKLLVRKATGRVDGLVIEGPTAGGHNAPPRGPPQFNTEGEPAYGDRDKVDLATIGELNVPFWIAGGAGHPERLREARAAGAAGVQVGTLFAYCDESGFPEDVKRSVLAHAARGEVQVRTDPRASPTGYPFKVVEWPAHPAHGVQRHRVCDIGHLRMAYRTSDGRIGYRCAAEPEELYVKKGGQLEDTVGRQCLCNALLAATGHPQARAGGAVEPLILTSGDDLTQIADFLNGRSRYTAAEVINYLLTGTRPASAPEDDSAPLDPGGAPHTRHV